MATLRSHSTEPGPAPGPATSSRTVTSIIYHAFLLVSRPRALPSLGIGDRPNPEPHARPRHVRSDRQHVQPRQRAAEWLAGGLCRRGVREEGYRVVAPTLLCGRPGSDSGRDPASTSGDSPAYLWAWRTLGSNLSSTYRLQDLGPLSAFLSSRV